MTSDTQHDDHRSSPSSLRQSGGLQWHLRALRYQRLHDPFRHAVDAFLQGWNPGTSHLVLVGPSAGWFLPRPFLHHFSRLTLIDLDTSAPFFFALRHGRSLRRRGVELEWLHADFVGHLPRVLSENRRAAVLFCNVLGQLGVERDDYEERLRQLPKWLVGRSWASFHDRYSSSIVTGAMADSSSFMSVEPMDEVMLQQLGCSGEWTDHGTGGVFPDGMLRHYFPWRITPSRFHWIEAGAVT